MLKQKPHSSLSALFRHLGHPMRIRIIEIIGKGEACVCHLEAQLGARQAYLSQHLMALRDADILITNREGRYIYYRLADPKILDMIHTAARALDVGESDLSNISPKIKTCSCPKCTENY